jgi:type II secretory pathway pseudopilin PulG
MKRHVRAAADAGFTMVEILVASAISVAVLGAILAVVNPVQTLLRAQGELEDMHQRLRAAADTLMGDLRLAGSIRPYRIGAVRDDGLAGIHYRPDTVAVLGTGMTTYYLKTDTSQLMQYDGGRSDLPMIDHVVRLAFDYLGPASLPGTPLVRLDPGILVDGPWTEDASHRLFDTDLLRISEVRIDIRFEATAPSFRRLVPDDEIVLHVALRNSSFAR